MVDVATTQPPKVNAGAENIHVAAWIGNQLLLKTQQFPVVSNTRHLPYNILSFKKKQKTTQTTQMFLRHHATTSLLRPWTPCWVNTDTPCGRNHLTSPLVQITRHLWKSLDILQSLKIILPMLLHTCFLDTSNTHTFEDIHILLQLAEPIHPLPLQL